MRRIDPEAVREHFENLSDEQLRAQNEADISRADAEYEEFVAAYQIGECYLCGKSFKTISKSSPCVHWLLRQCKFKKKDFPLVYEKFGYVQIAAFVRWVANQERFLSSINDLADEKGDRKILEYTVKWKNIEWTFDCSKNDYEGHGGTHSNFPHFHFQMRIDSKPFINFGDFHIPFSEEDLFHLDLAQALPDSFHHWFGKGGVGMQDAAEVSPEDIIEYTEHTDNHDEATYRLQTMIMAGETPFSGEQLQAMFEESKRTGATLASLARKYLPDAESINTVVSPADSVPTIARRSERKRR
ncbi:hypothetical protein [Aliidiomarina maris]|uniref:Uncharacterized protein n=1 Tax=Aliidiomarina maris TaxID=531312 RepID=A0A327WMW2_9GAMM|nr:hypothetical protein [Aliidiomarina maris]RAJ93333.1 hypothetical protein B0I24_12060 [Aliidiomarina maris]RUO18586.1 hypothetical protein CWE07_13900 [Aliidiomarina maris]